MTQSSWPQDPNGPTKYDQATCRCHQSASDGAEVIPSPLLVFHVGYISDRRIIKAAVNAWPFPWPSSCRPLGQFCAFSWEEGVGVETIQLMDFPHFPWLWT
ncbi:hypothetical protein ATANTOWER_005934 [Ataeniobius toweri]|uniref:Uncharacterized protein n=1 Tax=Ataeniobius toweri TaxID=208326 RepID=A0ABU7ADL9_9TELE|nr:hypothetical protein [Ataeniobius toweri]